MPPAGSAAECAGHGGLSETTVSRPPPLPPPPPDVGGFSTSHLRGSSAPGVGPPLWEWPSRGLGFCAAFVSRAAGRCIGAAVLAGFLAAIPIVRGRRGAGDGRLPRPRPSRAHKLLAFAVVNCSGVSYLRQWPQKWLGVGSVKIQPLFAGVIKIRNDRISAYSCRCSDFCNR